jgi:hypothetical protein
MNTDEVRANLTALYETADPLFDGVGSAEELEAYHHRISDFLGADMVLHNPGATPWGGTLRGRDNVIAAMKGIQAKIGTRKVALRAVLVDGNDGLALVDLTYANARGDIAHTTVAECFRFDDDGRVAEVFVHFFDTAAMLAFHAAGAGT